MISIPLIDVRRSPLRTAKRSEEGSRLNALQTKARRAVGALHRHDTEAAQELTLALHDVGDHAPVDFELVIADRADPRGNLRR